MAVARVGRLFVSYVVLGQLVAFVGFQDRLSCQVGVRGLQPLVVAVAHGLVDEWVGLDLIKLVLADD